MTILSYFLAFGLLAVLHLPWIQNSSFVFFVVNVLIKGGGGGLRNQVVNTLV
jgi:hypothetical protein